MNKKIEKFLNDCAEFGFLFGRRSVNIFEYVLVFNIGMLPLLIKKEIYNKIKNEDNEYFHEVSSDILSDRWSFLYKEDNDTLLIRELISKAPKEVIEELEFLAEEKILLKI